MKNKNYYLFLRLFVFLCPLLYVFAGSIFSPLFYFLVVLLTFLGLRQPLQPVPLPYEKAARKVFYFFAAFVAFQVIPLPVFLLKHLSPATVEALGLMSDRLPLFHPVSLVPFATLLFAFKAAAIVFFFRVLIALKWEENEILSLLNTLVYSAVLLVVTGVFTAVAHISFLPSPAVGDASYPFVFYIVMIFPLVPALLLMELRFFQDSRILTFKYLYSYARNWRVISLVISAGVILGGVLFTRSANALLVLFLSCVVLALWLFYFKRSHHLRKQLSLVFILLFAAIVFMGLQGTVREMLRVDEHMRENVRWSQTFTMIEEFPVVGTGFGTRGSVELLYEEANLEQLPAQADSSYLQVLAEGGIVGSVLFFLVLLFILAGIIRRWWHRRHPRVKMLGLGILTAVLAVCLHALFNTSAGISINLTVLVLLMVLGIKVADFERHREQGQERQEK